jgi:hypothetical protein
MPGKQMSIDADMRAGIIDLHQARSRREMLACESQFYGTMDGAMKARSRRRPHISLQRGYSEVAELGAL